MNKYILISVLFLTVNLSIAQQKLSINTGYGNYLYNSENSTKIMFDEKFRSFIFYGISYQNEKIFGHTISFEYNYSNITKEDLIKFFRTDPDTPEIIDEYGGDLSLVNHTFDIDYVGKISDQFTYGIGLSFIITNRIIDIKPPDSEALYDKLASSGIGVNVFGEFIYPLNPGEKYFFLTSKIKLRYTHSIWFDEGIRKLDNYNQSFLTAQISAGIGYSF